MAAVNIKSLEVGCWIRLVEQSTGVDMSPEIEEWPCKSSCGEKQSSVTVGLLG